MFRRDGTTSLISTVLVSIGLAALGVLLAQLLFGTSPRSKPQDIATAPALQTDTPTATEQRGRLQDRARAPVRKSIAILLEALDSGEPASLQLLRADLLRGFETYEPVVLPALKERALDNLLARLSAEDRADWPRAYMANDGKPSRARVYIDDLWAVNSDLGVFLETTAALIYRLQLNTKIGQPFDLRGAIRELFTGAVSLPPGRSVEGSFSRTIHFDAIFRSRFERERGRLVAEYLGSAKRELPASFDLIFSVQPRYVEEPLYTRVAELLAALSTEESPTLRKRVFEEERQVHVLRELAKKNFELRRALADLYAVGAVDAIENRDLELTKRFLSESRSLEQGLRSQVIVLEFLKQLGLNESDLLYVEKGEETANPVELNSGVDGADAWSPRNTRRAESSGSVPWLWIVLGIVVIAFFAYGGTHLVSRVREILEERKLREFVPPSTDGTMGGSGSTFVDWKLDDLSSSTGIDWERKSAQSSEK